MRRAHAVSPTLIRETARALVVSAGGQLALVASGVLGARMLGVAGRGQLALILLVSSIVTQLGSLGLPLALTYWTARDGGLTRRSQVRIVSFGIQQALVVTGVHAAILVALFAHASPALSEAAVISLIATPALLVYQYSLAILQGERRFSSFNAQRLALPALYAVILTAQFVLGTRSLIAVTIAWDVAVVVLAISSTLSVRRSPVLLRDVEAPHLSEMIRFGTKGLLGAATPLEAFQLDQAVVGLFISPTALGVYVVGVAFTNVPRLAGQAIGLVAYPHLAAQSDPRRVRRATLRFLVLGLTLCGMATAAVELALPWAVPFLFGHSFLSAVGVARVLLISALLVSMRRLVADCARGLGAPGVGSAAEIAAFAFFPLAVLVVGDDTIGVAWALVLSGALALGLVAPRMVSAMRRPHDAAAGGALPLADDEAGVLAESVVP